MTTFFARRGGPRRPVRPEVPRIGHFYLAATGPKLYCLNETARQLVREGMPMTARDLALQPLVTLEGEAVASQDLPMFRALREGRELDTVFLLELANSPAQVLAWHVSPLKSGKRVSGVFGTLTIPPPETDWEELAGLAHDLCSPLQAMRNLVAVIQTSPLLGPAAEALERLKSVSERGVSLSRDMLEFCRSPQLGAPRGERGWVALAPLLESLAAEQNPVAQKKGIRLDADLNAATGVEAHTDAGRLTRLVGNLLVNAIRYTTAGHVRLLSSWREDGDLTLTVEDTGAGIASEDPDSIFQPYRRGRAGKSDSDSSGLGLAVVDRLVSELDFTLEVFSEHGQGSRFDLLVPAPRFCISSASSC
jgi:two-component sensor histidine kinase